jgi:hypothetical protein
VDPQSEEAQFYRHIRAGDTDHPMSFLAERFQGPIGSLPVLCHGSGDLIRIAADDVLCWREQFWHQNPHGYGADFAESGYPTAQGIALPQDHQAAGFLSFGWGDQRSHMIIYGAGSITKGSGPTSA